MDVHDEKYLIERVKAGDTEAFTGLVNSYKDMIYTVCLRMLKSEADAEEAAQDVFVKIWESRQQLRKYDSFDSFLFTVAYNTTMSFLRKKASEKKYLDYIKSIQLTKETPKLDEKIDLETFNEKLTSAISNMPPRQQEVFKLKHFENLSYKQIADKLGISINTVENHITKSHRFLKEKLKDTYLAGILFISLFL